MLGESIEAMRERLGDDIWAFGLVVVGGLPADKEKRQELQARIVDAVSAALEPLEAEGVALGSLALRAEHSAVYMMSGLPNAKS